MQDKRKKSRCSSNSACTVGWRCGLKEAVDNLVHGCLSRMWIDWADRQRWDECSPKTSSETVETLVARKPVGPAWREEKDRGVDVVFTDQLCG